MRALKTQITTVLGGKNIRDSAIGVRLTDPKTPMWANKIMPRINIQSTLVISDCDQDKRFAAWTRNYFVSYVTSSRITTVQQVDID